MCLVANLNHLNSPHTHTRARAHTNTHTHSLISSLPFMSPSDAAAADAVYKDAIMVSFSAASRVESATASIPNGFTLGTNFFFDTGKTFGSRSKLGSGASGTGQKYGWSCPMEAQMENGFDIRRNKAPITASNTVAVLKTCSAGTSPTLGKDYKTRARWSMEVPNGVYDVYTHQVRWGGGGA